MPIRALVMLAVLGGVAGAGPFVHWQAPAECPDAADVEQRVAQRLGPDARAAAPIDVTVHAETAGFAAEIGDARTLTSTSCTELADAAALVVARLALEEPAIVERVAPPARPITREHAFAIGVRLSGVSGVGAQPSLSIGAELAVPLRWRSLFVEPAITEWRRSSTTDALSGVEAYAHEAALRIGWRSSIWPVRAWVVADVDQLSGGGLGPVYVGCGSAVIAGTWVGIGAGGAVTWAVDRHVAIVSAGELLAALLQPQFDDLLYQPDAVAARLTLGIEVSWP